MPECQASGGEDGFHANDSFAWLAIIASMNSKHRKILEAVFARPTTASLSLRTRNGVTP